MRQGENQQVAALCRLGQEGRRWLHLDLACFIRGALTVIRKEGVRFYTSLKRLQDRRTSSYFFFSPPREIGAAAIIPVPFSRGGRVSQPGRTRRCCRGPDWRSLWPGRRRLRDARPGRSRRTPAPGMLPAPATMHRSLRACRRLGRSGSLLLSRPPPPPAPAAPGRWIPAPPRAAMVSAGRERGRP